MKTLNNLPIFQAVLEDDECGVYKVSLVDLPAVQSDFIYFNEQEKKDRMLFSVKDEEQHIVRGVLMRANYPIYRYNPFDGEFYITFSPETIRLMAEKYLVDGYQNIVNLMHMDGTDVSGVDMVQMFIKDVANGIDPKGFEDIEDGSLFGEFKVRNEMVWQDIKEGKFKGFSIECVFAMEPVEDEKNEVDEILEIINKINNHINKNK